MKFYIAASSSEIERAERLMKIARARGDEITHDWTVDVRDAIARGVREEDIHDEVALVGALMDIGGVVKADRLVYLVPPKPLSTSGAWVELGVAHTLREFVPRPGYMKPLQIVCAGSPMSVRRSIFTRLADAFVYSDVDALEPELRLGDWWKTLRAAQAEDAARHDPDADVNEIK